MAKYLVTGGAGFIGSAIVKKLLDSGDRVYVIDNLKTGYLYNVPSNVEFVEGDFAKDSVLEKLGNIKFDAILHIGGQSSGEISFEDPEYDLNTNTLSTIKLLQYCLKTGCKKIIYASTMSIYGEYGNKEKFSELDETNPKSFYAVGKLASEKYLKIFLDQFGINFVSLRYFNVYGPGQNLENMKQGMVSIYLKQFFDKKYEEVIVKGDLKRFRDLVYVDDVVDITIDSISNENYNNKIINIGTGVKTTVEQILSLIKEYTGILKDIKIEKGTPGDQFGIIADNSLLKSIYKKELTTFETGLKSMIHWIKENE